MEAPMKVKKKTKKKKVIVETEQKVDTNYAEGTDEVHKDAVSSSPDQNSIGEENNGRQESVELDIQGAGQECKNTNVEEACEPSETANSVDNETKAENSPELGSDAMATNVIPSPTFSPAIPIFSLTPRSRTDSEFSELYPESPSSELMSIIPHINASSPMIPEEIGVAMKFDLEDTRTIQEIVSPLEGDSLEICQEAASTIPTAPTNTCESGDFFSLQSMKHSLDNINDMQVKPMHQILEEQEMQYQIVLPQRPLGESQIMHLYSNYLLENKETAVENFLSSAQTSYPGFELYELLGNYLRAWNQLGGCEKSLVTFKDQCEDFEKQVWTISSEKLTKAGLCMDGNSVTGVHQIHTAHLNKVVLNQLNKTLKDLKELLKDSFPLHMYSVQLCKAQIEHFFYKSFHHVNLQYFGVQGFVNSYPNTEVKTTAELLKLSISTLFLFLRKPQIHTRFLQECQRWLDRCVGLLLRIATLEDHLFILNQVARCPSGLVGKWASKFVQIPPIPIPSNPDDYISSYGHLHLDYALTVLSCVLNPVQKRSEFLHQNISGGSSVNGNDSSLQWVVVDSDGEDETDDSVVTFKENDVVSLLHQVPFEALFARALQVCRQGEEYIYGGRPWTEHCVLKLLAFSNQLVDILGDGFATYNDDRYRRLVKLLGRLILHTAQYVTNQLDHILKSDSFNSYVMREYDLFLFRAVKALHRGKKIGTMQFLATIPFHLASIEMLWEIYGLLTCWNMYDGIEMKSEDISADFEQQLVTMNESDAFYLLTAMSSIAIAREGKDNGFVRIVTIHLFQIGFLSPLTRDSCSKQARDLLASLTRKFPHLISVLIQSIKPKMDILENMSLYLLKELAFSYWKISDYDVHILSNWMLNFHPTSLENQIARFIIQSLNWNFDESGQLFLSVGVHRKVALLVVESQTKWEKCQNIITESVKQVSGINLRPQEVNFTQWGWEVIKRLHLHVFDQSNCGDLRLTKYIRNLPTFEGHSELEVLRKAVEDRHPLGSLVTLLMTPAGHSLPLICSKGFDMIETLIAHYKFEAAIQSLFYITPLFASSKDTVAELKSKRFLTIISTFLTSDMSYVKMAKSLISPDFPGAITKLLGEMIGAQLQQKQRLGTEHRKLVRLWTEVLTGCEGWNKDNNYLYLLDILARFSFQHEDCRTFFYEFFIEFYRKMPVDSQSGLTSYLLGWGSTSCSTVLANVSYPQAPFLAYFVFHIEMQLENLSGFWKSVCHSMGNPKNTVDIAVKKASATCKYNGSVNYLTVYRFAQQALDLSFEHPLVLIFWQKFFLRYFHRMSADEIYQGGVGDRFFEGMGNVSFLKKLKRRLHDLVQHYQTELNKFSESVVENQSDSYAMNPASIIEFHKSRLELATAMTLWIEDPQLHKDALYLPALPPQFLATKLLLLIEGSQEDWSEFVDFDAVSTATQKSARQYLIHACRITWIEPHRAVRTPDWVYSQGNAVDDILKRLKSYDIPQAPPEVPTFKQVLPVASPSWYTDWGALHNALKPHFGALVSFARSFSMQVSQHTALDCSYMEYLPDLYKNHDAETVVTVRCSGTRKWEPCSGPAHILFKYKEARLNERMGHLIQLNRTEYHTLIDQKSLQPPPESMCVSAVFIEDIITNLLIHCRNSQSPAPKTDTKFQDVGRELFYKIITLMNEECNFYPPTRQLFSSFIEVLGGEFIASDEKQYMTLVNICIRNSHFSHVVGAVAPHINLVNCTSKQLIDIYENVASIAKREPDMAFVILSKLDLGAWLGRAKPSPQERTRLLGIMWKVLTSEGIQPSETSLLIFGVFQQHFKTMLLCGFPHHYNDVLTLLLQGIEQQCVPLDIWYDFFHVLSNCCTRFSRGGELGTKAAETRRFATETCILSHELILETIHVLGNHFTNERLAIGLYGLYPKYRTYSEPISCFLQMMAFSVTVSSLKRRVGQPIGSAIQEIWAALFELYSPWILPYDQKMIQQKCSNWIQHFNFDTASVLHPWIPVDAQFAAVFMDNFCEALVFLIDNLPGASELLSQILHFYLNYFAQPGVKDHVLCIVNNSLINYIPWRVFWPTIADVEAMNKVVEKYLPAAHGFLGCIFVQVNWPEWVYDTVNANSAQETASALNSKLYALLLNLTVRLANDGVARELLQWGDVMERAMRMNWGFVPTNSVEAILNWFVMSIDPRVVLNSSVNHPMEVSSFMLVKVACGFLDASVNACCMEQTADLARKRYFFVRTYVRLLLSVASKFKNYLQTEVKSIEKSVQAMVTDAVVVAKLEGQSKEDIMPILKELFTLMGNHYLGTITRNAFIEWCDKNKDVPMPVLYGFIHCCLDNKVPAYTTVPLIEASIRLCFRHRDASWDSIVEVAAVTDNAPELSSYYEVAYRDGHYLVLYALLLRRFDSLAQGGIGTVSFLMDVLKNLKPKESNEVGLPLLSDILLKLNFHLLLDAKKGSSVEKNVRKFLNTFAQHLLNLGDDKGGWGLLGALGLGSSSVLSPRGRLFCRCMGTFIQAQLPVGLPVRTKPEDGGHFITDPGKPHQDVCSNLEKLESLKLVRHYAELGDCIDQALECIKDGSKCLCLGDIESFIQKLVGNLFTETFLYRGD